MAAPPGMCRMCREFAGHGERVLCSVCARKFEAMPEAERPDLEAIPTEAYRRNDGAGADPFAEINEELAKMEPNKFMPLIEGHTMRTMMFPVSADEAAAMQRAHRKSPNPGDGAVIDGLVGRMDAFLLEHDFRDEGGKLCAFAKICDVSPKDVLGGTLDDIKVAAEEYAASYDLPCKNVTLQSLIYAKATHKPTSLKPGARGIVELLIQSERCMGDQGLEIKGFPDNPQPVAITLRDWLRMDPAFEFRCFVNNDKLRAISSMATMDIYGIHYPQVVAQREEILAGAKGFFSAIGPKLAPLSAGLMVPGRYVIDLYFDVRAGRWYVVELNPFVTSLGGHLFSEDYGGRWAAWDALPDDPVDLRVWESTVADVVDGVPESWREYLRCSPDVYGPDA